MCAVKITGVDLEVSTFLLSPCMPHALQETTT